MGKQTGTAIFTALFMVAIVSAISIAMVGYQRLDIMRTQQIVTSAQAEQYADGAIYWAISELKNPALVPTSIKWPKIIPETLIQNAQGAITAELYYYNERFNLNELTNAQKIPSFKKVMDDAGLKVDDDWVNEVSTQIIAWLNKGESVYDENYLSLNPPYRMGHKAFSSVSELRLIEGVTAEQYESVSQLFSAFPVNSPDKFLLHTVVQINEQQLQMYVLLQRSVSQGKVEVITQWHVFGAF